MPQGGQGQHGLLDQGNEPVLQMGGGEPQKTTKQRTIILELRRVECTREEAIIRPLPSGGQGERLWLLTGRNHETSYCHWARSYKRLEMYLRSDVLWYLQSLGDMTDSKRSFGKTGIYGCLQTFDTGVCLFRFLFFSLFRPHPVTFSRSKSPFSTYGSISPG